MPKQLNSMKRVRKKVPLLPKLARKDTLFSDLLRSEPHSDKGTLFCEFLDTHVNTYCKCGPHGYGIGQYENESAPLSCEYM